MDEEEYTGEEDHLDEQISLYDEIHERNLELNLFGRMPWSIEDEKKLYEMAIVKGISVNRLDAVFPNRSHSAIARKIESLKQEGIKERWTELETDISLLGYLMGKKPKEIAEKLKEHANCVRDPKKISRKNSTVLAKLKAGFNTDSKEEIAKIMIPHLTNKIANKLKE